jgi:hypothetical protein
MLETALREMLGLRCGGLGGAYWGGFEGDVHADIEEGLTAIFLGIFEADIEADVGRF